LEKIGLVLAKREPNILSRHGVVLAKAGAFPLPKTGGCCNGVV
jgi:hypothetical protein